jgi:hypothetical protein
MRIEACVCKRSYDIIVLYGRLADSSRARHTRPRYPKVDKTDYRRIVFVKKDVLGLNIAMDYAPPMYVLQTGYLAHNTSQILNEQDI